MIYSIESISGGYICLTPKCSRILSKPQKQKFWRIERRSRSRNATWARGEVMRPGCVAKKCDLGAWRSNATWARGEVMRPGRVAKKVKKGKETKVTHQSCHVRWGPGLNQPCQVSSKSVPGFWLPEGSKSAIFLRLPPNL